MKPHLLFFLSLNLFTITSCGQGKVSNPEYDTTLQLLLNHSVSEISVNEARKEQKATFLDARTFEEYNVSHIKNAIWIGYETFDSTRVEQIDKNSMIIVYCSVGYRSEKVSEKLARLGFTNTYNLYGGIFEWVNKELPIVANEKKTSKIHAYDKTWGKWLEKGEKVYQQ